MHPADSTTFLSPSTGSASSFAIPPSQVATQPYVLMTVPKAYIVGKGELPSSSPPADLREEKSHVVDESSKDPIDPSDIVHSAEPLVKEQGGAKEELLSVSTLSGRPSAEMDLGVCCAQIIVMPSTEHHTSCMC